VNVGAAYHKACYNGGKQKNPNKHHFPTHDSNEREFGPPKDQSQNSYYASSLVL
jgi:hypothetical protein